MLMVVTGLIYWNSSKIVNLSYGLDSRTHISNRQISRDVKQTLSTVKPRIWNTGRSTAKVFHMRGSIFGVIYQINAVFMTN